MNVVFTGKFIIDEQHIVRELLEQMCEEKGWNTQKAIDWNTDYLVQSSNGGLGTVKAKKAQDCCVKVITPEEFWEMAKNAS